MVAPSEVDIDKKFVYIMGMSWISWKLCVGHKPMNKEKDPNWTQVWQRISNFMISNGQSTGTYANPITS